MKPRLLSLFCGAGGDSMGYYLAGFDVVGVDIEPQPRYPFRFFQADALEVLADTGHPYLPHLSQFAAIHASPPCQDHSVTAALWKDQRHGNGWMLADTMNRLKDIGIPWVVENVGGARSDMGGSWVQLCGSSFGLGVIRHRLFASSVPLMVPPCQHSQVKAPLYIYGHSEDAPTRDRYERLHGVRPGHAERAKAMGIDWMNRDELVQAIPPAFTEFIGEQLLAALPSLSRKP